MGDVRGKQLSYSTLQARMHVAEERRQKARKILSVLRYHLGREDLSGVRILDLGCSLGWFVETAVEDGASAVGIDIDAPGLATARRDRDKRCAFLAADGEALPFGDGSVDVVVFNHIYEHVVDPDVVVAEIRRVLKPEGIVYLGLGNRLGLIEPHYKLPFLSWLPHRVADRYVRIFGRADNYYERFRTLRGLRRMTAGLHVYDYSFSVVADPSAFSAEDISGGAASEISRRIGRPGRRLARWVLPTFIWVAGPSPRPPRGTGAALPPEQLT
jgi:SAM-dependent methyltransferase